MLRIPKTRLQCHNVKATLHVHEYSDGGMVIFHGPHKLAKYVATGELSVQAA